MCSDFQKTLLSINKNQDESNYESLIPQNKLSISCVCHTSQFIQKDLVNKDKIYKYRVDIMNFTSFIQSQRLNSA